MIKIKRLQKQDYNIVAKTLASDKQLSWSARGIFLYLYAHGDEEIIEHEIIGENMARYDTLMLGMRELVHAGYLRCNKTMTRSNQPVVNIWELSLIPVFKKGNNQTEKATLSLDINDFSPLSDFSLPVKPIVDNPVLEKPVLENRTLINTNKTNTKYNKNQIKQIPNTPEQVPDQTQAACIEIITYLNAKTGRRYNPHTMTTQRLIKARLQEGYQVTEFIKVIDTKVSQWMHDDKWRVYLRPSTLFGHKFDNYINEEIREVDQTRNGEVWYE